jgi:MscS family membrane protein
LNAAHKGNYELAAQYMDTRLRDKSAAILAHQLFVVLDRRLPARLNQLSDKSEGSLPNPLKPDQDLVGTITSANGNVDILLDRVDIDKGELRWLFSTTTFESIPRLYYDVNIVSVDRPAEEPPGRNRRFRRSDRNTDRRQPVIVAPGPAST